MYYSLLNIKNTLKCQISGNQFIIKRQLKNNIKKSSKKSKFKIFSYGFSKKK